MTKKQMAARLKRHKEVFDLLFGEFGYELENLDSLAGVLHLALSHKDTEHLAGAAEILSLGLYELHETLKYYQERVHGKAVK